MSQTTGGLGQAITLLEPSHESAQSQAETEAYDLNGHTRAESDLHRATSKNVRDSIRLTLQQATELKDIAFEVVKQMREPFLDQETADYARARAQAVTALIKGWEAACERIRIVRKIPMPGAMKHLPEQPKTRKKAKPMNKPPVIPGPVEAKDPDSTTGQGTPSI